MGHPVGPVEPGLIDRDGDHLLLGRRQRVGERGGRVGPRALPITIRAHCPLPTEQWTFGRGRHAAMCMLGAVPAFNIPPPLPRRLQL